MMVVFKMRDSLPGARYPPICNVLRQWKTSLIPIYRVYRLYDNYYNNYYTHTQCKVQIYNSNVNFKENYHVARKYARIIIIAIIIITILDEKQNNYNYIAKGVKQRIQ